MRAVLRAAAPHLADLPIAVEGPRDLGKPSYAEHIAAEEPPPLDPLDDALNVTKALRRRGVGMHCPACDWTLDGPLGDYVLTPVGRGTPDLRPGITLAVYACRNCGYVRLHSASVLRDALGE